MEDQQQFVFNASSLDKPKRKWIVVRKGGAGCSSGAANSVSSATTPNGSAPTPMLQSFASLWSQGGTNRPSISTGASSDTATPNVSTPSSSAPFCASSTSMSVPHMDVSKTASSSIFVSAFSRPSVTILPEKMVQVVSSGESGHLENVTEWKQETTQKENTHFFQTGAPVPNDVVNEKEKEKPEEISDSAPNSPLPLIPISRFLKGIPQSPHFLQLRRSSELVRERLVAAWDQTFEETVEQIHGLKAKDFWDRASELWKVMEELQNMGYNVVPIRRRLVEMTEVMIELKQSKLEILKLKIKADNHRMERSRLENMILCLQARVEREEVNNVQVLNEVDKMEKELPKYDGLIASLAIKSFGVNN